MEAAWKIARQFHRLNGEVRWKAVARQMAYHGTTLGALDLTGLPSFARISSHWLATHCMSAIRGAHRSRRGSAKLNSPQVFWPNSNRPSPKLTPALWPWSSWNRYRITAACLCLRKDISRACAISATATAFFCRRRDHHCIWRLGEWFGSTRVGMEPDIITTAKGLSSAHAVIGAVIVSDRVYEPFARHGRMLMHGNTFGGHPVMAAVALRNLDIMERLDLNSAVRANEGSLRKILESLRDIPVVKDVRGAGYFYAVELTTRDADGSPLSAAALADLYGTDNLGRLLEAQGLFCASR